MPAGWRLEGDALACGGLRVALQRIGASHWRAQGVLRSWGLAQLHRDVRVVSVPCADDEALWLGAWAEPAGSVGTVSLHAGIDVPAVRIEVPRQQAITALGDGRPMTRGTALRSELALELAPSGASPQRLTLVLLPPARWSTLSGRHWTPLAGPPPLPPRLG